MQCAQCNHSLSLDKKRNIMAVYPQRGKADIVCMFVGASQGTDLQGEPRCTVLAGWRGEQDGLEFSARDSNIHDACAAAAFETASKHCPVDVLFINQGADETNFQFLMSMIKAARAAHPRINIFSAGKDKKLSVRYRGDETETEKAEVYHVGLGLVRDLAIAVKAVDQ